MCLLYTLKTKTKSDTIRNCYTMYNKPLNNEGTITNTTNEHIIRTVACEYNACDVQYRQIQSNISTGDISSVKSAMIIKRFRNLACNPVTGARWATKASTWPPTRRHLNSLWTTPSFTGKPFGGSNDPRPYGSLK